MAGRIKICGIRRPQDIEAINACAPDYAGFIFAPESRRYIKAAAAHELRLALNEGIIPVGVFVNEKAETIAAVFEAGTISIAQLHGAEDVAFRARLKALCGVPVIQAVRVAQDGIKNEAVVEAAVLAAAEKADYVLFDAPNGGSGQTFDWPLLSAKALHLLREKGFLAGGININNIAAALELKPFAIDVSSGVETEGVKDALKMASLVKAARRS